MNEFNKNTNQNLLTELSNGLKSFHHTIKQVADNKRMLKSAFEPHKNAIKQLTDQLTIMRTAIISQNNPIQKVAEDFKKFNSMIVLNHDKFIQISNHIINIKSGLAYQQDYIKLVGNWLKLTKPAFVSQQIAIEQLFENNFVNDAINYVHIFSQKARNFARKQLLAYYLLDIIEIIDRIENYMSDLDQPDFEMKAEMKSTDFLAMCFLFIQLPGLIRKLPIHMREPYDPEIEKFVNIRNDLAHNDPKFEFQILWDMYDSRKLMKIKQFVLAELSKL